MFPVCVYCQNRCWPWQHWSGRVVGHSRRYGWHDECAFKYAGGAVPPILPNAPISRDDKTIQDRLKRLFGEDNRNGTH